MTDDLECVDLPTRTRELFDDVTFMASQYGTLHDKQRLLGDRIGWQMDVWEHDGDARWTITVEAVGS